MSEFSRFVICNNCHEHGRFVFVDGTQTREFWTRHMGFDLIIEHQKAGHLTEQQASELGRQVSASGLPRDKSEKRGYNEVLSGRWRSPTPFRYNMLYKRYRYYKVRFLLLYQIPFNPIRINCGKDGGNVIENPEI